MSELVLEKSNGLPENWTEFQFDTCLTLKYGKGLTKKNRKKEGKIPVYGSSGVDGYHTESLVKNPCLIIGRKGSVGEVHYVDKPCWAIDTTYFLNEYPMYDLKFLYYLLIHMRLAQLDTSTTVPSLRRDDVYAIQMILPPLNEQKRIISKIEELFSILDNVQQVVSVSVKLATKLMQKVIDDFTSIKNIDFDVKEFSLGDIADIKGGVTLGRKLKGKTIKLPYLRVANVQDGYLDLEYIKDIQIFEREHDKWMLKSGDILLTEGGDRDKLGRGTVWKGQIPNCIHQNHIFRVRLDDTKFDPDYISMILRSSESKKFFQKKGKQSVNLASINKTQLSSFRFFCPQLNIQKKQLEIIQNSLDKLFKLQETTSDLIKIFSGLRIKILKTAFEGKLIPQDPNDEPIEILLQKIKKEKEQLIQQNPRGKKKNVK